MEISPVATQRLMWIGLLVRKGAGGTDQIPKELPPGFEKRTS